MKKINPFKQVLSLGFVCTFFMKKKEGINLREIKILNS